jgi:uncharacterized coiled-coil protein SlyX
LTQLLESKSQTITQIEQQNSNQEHQIYILNREKIEDKRVISSLKAVLELITQNLKHLAKTGITAEVETVVRDCLDKASITE